MIFFGDATDALAVPLPKNVPSLDKLFEITGMTDVRAYNKPHLKASRVKIPLRPVRKSRRPTSTWQIVKSAFEMHV